MKIELSQEMNSAVLMYKVNHGYVFVAIAVILSVWPEVN